MLFLCLQCISFVAFSQTWILKWQDSFEANASPDTTVWSLEKDGRGGGNSEFQCYLSDNVSIETYQGLRCLVLNARTENYLWALLNKPCAATSGRVNTQGKYGKVEILKE